MGTYVFVPGGWHGGWVYEDVCADLAQRGHVAHAVTPTGLDPQSPGESANLRTHIDDVVRHLASHDLDDVVLCGHSYAGMIVRGVVDSCPERLVGAVYIDAYVPESGDSCWSLTSDRFRAMFVAGSRRTGLLVDPPPGLDPRAVPHPLGSFMQELRLSGRDDDLHRCYIYLSRWRGSPFGAVYDRLRADPGWQTVELPTSHNIMQLDPGLLVDNLLRETAGWTAPVADARPRNGP
ncbi:alpha/beta fold hydrolase [Saccharopolyspora hirsuta]|uniref:alpha/beta fold hydrolase n=1 Tax=Saccharopolyspora hirsuta TaxID=1837 RepID=UPI001BAC9BA9|nr:alpha/beta fold hydrolase [Saccharopolyspora hirsuta]